MRTFLLLISTVFFINHTHAQYESGNMDIELGGGVGLYGVTSNDPADSSSGVGAATGMAHIGFNYAVIPRLSIGLNYERSGFATRSDSSGSNSANANNFRLNIVFRMLNIERSALSINASVGMSSFKITSRINGDYITSNGFSFELGIRYQVMFGKHIGMYQQTSYDYFKYSKLKVYDSTNDGEVIELSNSTIPLAITLNGANIRLGLVVKF